MAQNFFDVEKGYQIDSLRTWTSGTGDPTIDEVVGSIYTEDDGTLWQKRTAGAGVANWRRQATEEFVDARIDGRQWRDSVIVKEDSNFANLAAAEAQLNGGAPEFEGVTISDQDRILFTDIVGENKNVFIVNGTKKVVGERPNFYPISTPQTVFDALTEATTALAEAEHALVAAEVKTDFIPDHAQREELVRMERQYAEALTK